MFKRREYLDCIFDVVMTSGKSRVSHITQRLLIRLVLWRKWNKNLKQNILGWWFLFLVLILEKNYGVYIDSISSGNEYSLVANHLPGIVIQ